MVIIMDIMKKLLVLLAIFCIIGSAAAVSAADVYDDLGGYAGSQYQDGGYAGSQYQDGGYAGSQYDENEQGGYAGSQYQDDGGWAGSQYNETLENATGAPVNATANATATAVSPVENATANATAPHTMLATGNPILVLLAVGAVLGGAAVITRRK